MEEQNIQPAPQQKTKHFAWKWLAVATIVIIAIGLGTFLVLGHQGGKPPAYAHPVAYNNPLNPAPGTQKINITLTDGVLTSGPTKIYSMPKGAILFNFKMIGKNALYKDLQEYDIYIKDNNIDNEIDEADTPGIVTGQVYLQTNKTGSFEFGFHTDAKPQYIKLGTLIVQ